VGPNRRPSKAVSPVTIPSELPLVILSIAGFSVCVSELKLELILWRVRKIAKSDYLLCHVRPSVRPHGVTRLPQDGF
jgi:hypothetical protein